MNNLLRFFTLISILTITQGCSLLTAAGITSQGQPIKEVEGPLTSTTANSSVNVDHAKWDTLLKKYINQEGLVDYEGFQNDRAALNSYLDQLASLEPNDDWSVQELLAYYINLYNAATVNLMLDNPNAKSIKDVDSPWTKNIARVGNTKLSLAGIENGVLRKMNEPRIHFAVNCASISCPPLLREAYTAGLINEQLDRATREFINSKENNISKTKAELSSIFDFYTKDFYRGGNESLIPYINKYSKVKVNADAAISFLPYDWNLNAQK